jgi:hypothetical protein
MARAGTEVEVKCQAATMFVSKLCTRVLCFQGDVPMPALVYIRVCACCACVEAGCGTQLHVQVPNFANFLWDDKNCLPNA